MVSIFKRVLWLFAKPIFTLFFKISGEFRVQAVRRIFVEVMKECDRGIEKIDPSDPEKEAKEIKLNALHLRLVGFLLQLESGRDAAHVLKQAKPTLFEVKTTLGIK